jgi:hypothetical protein
MSKFKPPGQCPVCHEFVPKKALACDYCGACAKTGWNEDAGTYDGVDLPEEDFDYDAFVQEEFGKGGRAKFGIHPLWKWVALLLLLVWVLSSLRR